MNKIILFSCALMLGASGRAQDMLIAYNKAHDKINVSVGFRVGEPTGINFQLYRGVTTGCTKYKGFFDFVLGKEGIIYGAGRSYGNNKWQEGGLRYSVTYFHELNHQMFGSLLYYGIGVQGGQRRFIESGKELEEFAFGPQLLLHGELPITMIEVTPRRLYTKLSLFAEITYHTQIGQQFSYFRPSFGIRFNFFY